MIFVLSFFCAFKKSFKSKSLIYRYIKIKNNLDRKKILVEWKMVVSLHSLSPKKRVC